MKRQRIALRRTGLAFVLATVFVVALNAPNSAGRADTSGAADLTYASAEPGEWRATLIGFGRVFAWRETTLVAPASGVATSVSADVGDVVEPGQTLMEFDSPILASILHELIDANRKEQFAIKLVDQVSQLHADKLAPLGDVLQARSNLADAREKLDEEWRMLLEALPPGDQHGINRTKFLGALSEGAIPRLVRDLGKIRAPFGARIARRDVAVGDPLTPGATLFTLEDMSRVYVDVFVAWPDIHVWQSGDADAVDDAGNELAALRAAKLLDADEPTGLARVRFQAENAMGALLDGQLVQVIVESKPRAVLWVPEAAVVGRDGKLFCIRQEGSQLTAVEVKAGPAVDGKIPIVSGLQSGDRVALSGAYELLYRDLKELVTFED